MVSAVDGVFRLLAFAFACALLYRGRWLVELLGSVLLFWGWDWDWGEVTVGRERERACIRVRGVFIGSEPD